MLYHQLDGIAVYSVRVTKGFISLTGNSQVEQAYLIQGIHLLNAYRGVSITTYVRQSVILT
jgi:hypothetical protein